MRNKLQVAILLMLFGLFVSQGPMVAYAETEGAPEGENTVEVQENAASSDASLVSLKIAQASLNPEFSPEQLTYTARVPHEVTRIALTAQTASPEARKIINGTGDLKVGENVITIEVTAEDGTVREYRVILTREASDGSEEETPEGQEPPEETISQEEIPEGSQTIEEETTESVQETSQTEEEKNNGGMQTAAPSDNIFDGDNFLTEILENHRLLLVILCVICLILLLIIITILLLRRGDWADDEDEDEEEFDEDEDIQELQVKESKKTRASAKTLGEEIHEDVEEFLEEAAEELFDPDESEEESDEDLDKMLLQLEKKVDVVAGDDVDDDLDDDFEMLLEDDDDFDFLDF